MEHFCPRFFIKGNWRTSYIALESPRFINAEVGQKEEGGTRGFMKFSEKSLYHQIHPAKLLTDWISTIPALYFLWQQELVLGLIFAFVPSIATTIIVIQFGNLEKYKLSPFGKYVAKYMTRSMQAVRSLGLLIMMFGAWYHAETWLVIPAWFLIPLGLVTVLLGWLRGKIFPTD